MRHHTEILIKIDLEGAGRLAQYLFGRDIHFDARTGDVKNRRTVVANLLTGLIAARVVAWAFWVSAIPNSGQIVYAPETARRTTELAFSDDCFVGVR